MPKKSSNSRKLLVSIVVRTKNEDKIIKKVFDSLKLQSFKNFEIIVIDDFSTDKTLKIIKQFIPQLKIKIINLKPGEFSHPYTHNLGALKAKGKYICYLVGHALPLTNNWLEMGLKNFQDPKVAGISGHYTENPIGYINRTLGNLLFKLEKRKTKEFDPWMTLTNCLIKKDLWRQYPFDEKLSECEDYDWGCEMLARGCNVIKDKEFSVTHSHYYFGRPGVRETLPRWQKIVTQIDKRKRPRKSFTKLKITS